MYYGVIVTVSTAVLLVLLIISVGLSQDGSKDGELGPSCHFPEAIDKSLAFNGKADFIFFDGSNFTDIAHGLSSKNLRLTQFSIAAWVYTEYSGSTGFIVNKGGTGSEFSGKNLNFGLFMGTSGQIGGGYETVNGTDVYVSSLDPYDDGKPHFIVLTYDSRTLRLFIDGSQVAQRIASWKPDNTGDQPVRLGANSLTANNHFQGYIDEVSIYNRPLTATDICAIYNNAKLITSSNGLVLHEKFLNRPRDDTGVDLGIFFYPWYSKYRHWNDSSHRPPETWASNFLPNINIPKSDDAIGDNNWLNETAKQELLIRTNLYNSNDTETLLRQIYLINSSGIEFAISSWWGKETYTDKVFEKIINRVQPSSTSKLKWVLLYEIEGYANPSVSDIMRDLEYIKTNYTQSPYYLHKNGKPVIFVYNVNNGSGAEKPLDDLIKWKAAKEHTGFYVVFKVDGLTRGVSPEDMDSWYQYAPAKYHFKQEGIWSAFISPGFWKYHEDPKLTRNLTTFENAIMKLNSSRVSWKLIETWNEWAEGTGIEPAKEIIHDDINGFRMKPGNGGDEFFEAITKYFGGR